MLKSKFAFLLGLLLAAVIPFQSVSAGSWDYVGFEVPKYNSTLKKYKTDIVHSTGGDFQICVANWGNAVTYSLWEYDAGSGNDDYVNSVTLKNGQCYAFRSIGGFVDGANKKAEFYVTTNDNKSQITFFD